MTSDYQGPFNGVQPNSQPIEKKVREQTSTVEVHSMFWTIQGEGPFSGTPAVFIRLAGCNLQCPWCDTEYTQGREAISPEVALQRVNSMPIHNGGLVVITGGEPFRQPAALEALCFALIDEGYYIQIETNGTLPPPKGIWEFCKTYIASRDRHGIYIVCSPKTGKVHDDTRYRSCCFKYVLDANNVDEDDGLPLTALNHTANPKLARPPKDRAGRWTLPVYVQPCDEQDERKSNDNMQAAVKSCMRFNYIMQLQTHKYLGLD